jgi:hypothetical protein
MRNPYKFYIGSSRYYLSSWRFIDEEFHSSRWPASFFYKKYKKKYQAINNGIEYKIMERFIYSYEMELGLRWRKMPVSTRKAIFKKLITLSGDDIELIKLQMALEEDRRCLKSF